MQKNQLHPSLLFSDFALWVLWEYLAMTSKSDATSLQKTLMFIFMQKIIFIPHLYLDILQRY